MKIFIDTNILLRFFIGDDSQQHIESNLLLKEIQNGKHKTYISNVVIIELIYTLSSFYKQKKASIIKKIESILAIRNLTVIEKTNSKQAMHFYKKLNLKYGDCLLATQVPKDVNLVTYDRDFVKFPQLKVIKPGEIYEN